MNNMQNKKQIFQHLHKVIGFTPKVCSFYDADETSEIDLYIGVDRPDFGITTYATIGLSDYSIGLATPNGKQIRVELIAICNSREVNFPNVLADCAFRIIRDKYSCKPGIVYPDMIGVYVPKSEMEHVYFTTPYLWEDLGRIEQNDRIILWLLAVPISDNEFTYLQENGSEAMETLFENNHIDVFDLNRKSVL